MCGKVVDPGFDPWLLPHTCGATCDRQLQPPCGHDCVLLCHPGPCPPCPRQVAFRPQRKMEKRICLSGGGDTLHLYNSMLMSLTLVLAVCCFKLHGPQCGRPPDNTLPAREMWQLRQERDWLCR